MDDLTPLDTISIRHKADSQVRGNHKKKSDKAKARLQKNVCFVIKLS